MKFFAYAYSADSAQLAQIKNTSKLFGIPLEFIGKGVRFKLDFLTTKTIPLYKAVCQLKDKEIVCCTDGFDVVYQDDAESIKNKFLSFNCDVVFSAEKEYVHQYTNYKDYFDSIANSSPYKYMNAGSVIGYARSLKILCEAILFRDQKNVFETITIAVSRIFTKILLWGGGRIRNKAVKKILNRIFMPWSLVARARARFDDQALIGQYIATNPGKIDIRLDYGCKLFWCTAFEWEEIDKHYGILNNKIMNVNTGNTPSCIHIPNRRTYEHILMKIYDIVMELNGKHAPVSTSL